MAYKEFVEVQIGDHGGTMTVPSRTVDLLKWRVAEIIRRGRYHYLEDRDLRYEPNPLNPEGPPMDGR